MTATTQRADDWNLVYHVRPVVVDLGTRRQVISPLEAQLLLGELTRLPNDRYRVAEALAASFVRGLAGACAIPLDEEERRAVLRAIEGVRARRMLPSGLGRLRGLLLEPVV